MKSTGFVRKVDDLGRIVIPKEIRQNLKIGDNSSLEIFSDSSSITIKKINHSCAMCGSKNRLLEFNDKFICCNCVDKLVSIKNKNH